MSLRRFNGQITDKIHPLFDQKFRLLEAEQDPPRLLPWRVAGVLCYFLFCFRLLGVALRLSACALSRPRQISNSVLVACIMSRTFQ